MQATRFETQASQPAVSARNTERTPSRRGVFLKWLRKVHGWVGLWGAVLGLLFGITGFLQNHRAVMKIRTPAPEVSTIEVALPDPAPKSPKELVQYLQTTLKLGDVPPGRVQKEPAHPVSWGDQSVIQPEHWTIRFGNAKSQVSADYWKGSQTVSVERRDQGLIGTIQSLHKSNGTSIGWVLFADSFAGSMILLSLTGVILWTGLNKRRTVGASIFIVSVLVMIGFAAQSV
ncbi:PepSY-associated TM helix domain-containing protein [Pararobbsia silviterrae]|uniref:Peptidase n=1 Tax=Pararobbsia silviterrae TaxID=1792498 RepID=A0A494XYV7_9BURK|nr:PepSY-associated TM helix domain-containing protein [Pararobbsia silviterrae]RKP55697.1 peptidase [Pararobbsia silviterrae]